MEKKMKWHPSVGIYLMMWWRKMKVHQIEDQSLHKGTVDNETSKACFH